MKAILEFNLPEDQAQHLLAISAPELYSACVEVEQAIRSKLKHGDLSDETRAELEAIRALLPAALMEQVP